MQFVPPPPHPTKKNLYNHRFQFLLGILSCQEKFNCGGGLKRLPESLPELLPDPSAVFGSRRHDTRPRFWTIQNGRPKTDDTLRWRQVDLYSFLNSKTLLWWKKDFPTWTFKPPLSGLWKFTHKHKDKTKLCSTNDAKLLTVGNAFLVAVLKYGPWGWIILRPLKGIAILRAETLRPS